jgi:hypothetical protein
MWTKLMQAAAITSMLYLVVGMSQSPAHSPLVQFEVSRYIQALLSRNAN